MDYIIKCGELIVQASDENQAKNIIGDDYYVDHEEIIKDLKSLAGMDEYRRCRIRDISISTYLATKNMNRKGKCLFKAYKKSDVIERIGIEKEKKQKEEKAEDELREKLKIEKIEEQIQAQKLLDMINLGQLELNTIYYFNYDQCEAINEQYNHVSTNRYVADDDLITVRHNGTKRQYRLKDKKNKKYCLIITEEYIPLRRKTQLVQKADIVCDGNIIETIIMKDLYLSNGYESMLSEYYYYDSLDELMSNHPELKCEKISEWYKKHNFKKKNKSTKKLKIKENELWVDARGLPNNKWEGRYMTMSSNSTFDVIANSSNEAELQALLQSLNKIESTNNKYDVFMDNEWVINGVLGAKYSYNWYQFQDIRTHKNYGSITKKDRSKIEKIWG